MRPDSWRTSRMVALLAILVSPVGGFSPAQAAPPDQKPARLSGPQVIPASYVGVSRPLGSLAPVQASSKTPSILRTMQKRLIIPKTQKGLSHGGFDASLVQDSPVGFSMPAAVANFEGVNNVSGVLPPDTQGDIGWDPVTGTKYYVQWVNLAFQVWDVTDPAAVTSLYGPAAGNTLWAGTGTICETNNDGDPITQFDHLSNRWMMSQFALDFPNDFHQCIAVSATADPTGAWYLYDFQTSTTMMNDYPHFGVWPDGYYMSVNQFDGTTYAWGGAGVAVFERSQMLSGLPARMIYLDLGPETLDYSGMLPSDLDGPAPADGTPNYFMEWDDTTWLGDANDTLRIWEFKTDWTTPANTTFGVNASYDPNRMISTANVDPDLCDGARDCIPQPDTAQGLDAISDRLMYRLQYRDYGTHQALVGNHTVDATSADKAGIHWFELRDSGAGFVMQQQGVYAPDADNRWMGSVAMDGSGNMALGYSVSSSATYPAVRYTGRLSTDPVNTLPQGEVSLIEGTGSQTHSAARWGDYSMMAVDASDGCTFWYTQEYVETTGSASWRTRIGSFKFPSCTTAPTSVLQGVVTDSTSAPLAGAAIGVSGGYGTITDATGHYAFNLVNGTYSVTASKYGYASANAPAVVVTAPGGATQDFSLVAAANSTISGVVTDATTGWPLYARVDIHGFPSGPIFTDPATGAYSVNLANGTYLFTVSAMSGGYTDSVLSLSVSASATRNFALAADMISCAAPGYVTTPGFAQNFETWPLTGWTIVDHAGVGVVWKSSAVWGDNNFTGGSGVAADVNSDNSYHMNYDTELVSPTIDPATLPGKNLTYKANFQSFSGLEALDLDITNDGGAIWTNISHWTTDHGSNGALPGVTVAVDLTPFITANFQLRWRYYTSQSSPWDWYAQVDEVAITGCAPVASVGLVIGKVNDANTGTPIENASVKDAALNSAMLIDTSADPAAPDKMYVIAEPAGTVVLTASAANSFYGTDTHSPTVVAGGTVRQDFNLPAGMLSADPASLSFTVTAVAPIDSRLLTLTNSGGSAADYEVFAFPGVFAGYTPIGPFAANTRHTGPKNLNDRTAQNVRMHFIPSGIPALAAGDVTASWSTGLTFAWGIGFNTDANDLWLGDLLAGGGDGRNHRFTTAGVNTGDTIDTASWVSSFNADMTYNPFTNKLWQVNVGGGNCIYEMDPAVKISTGNKICPPFGTSQRGLAFNPLTDTYYAGSWNDSIINHFAPDGTLLDAVSVGLDISGLAFNPGTGHLFVLSNTDSTTTPTHYDVTVLDTADSYAIVGGFNLMSGGVNAFGDYTQAGLEIDCNGDLWAVDQGAKKVYKAASGETGVCDWQTGSWLSATPATGSIAPAGTAVLTVSVDAAGMSVGTHQGYLRIISNTPYADRIVPVSVDVDRLFVTSPAAGQAWAQGSAHPIRWGGRIATGNVKILLYQGTSLKGTISANTPNDGAFDWIVPVSQLPGPYTVRVVWLSNPTVLANSAPFTVDATAGPITVTPPPAPVAQGAVKAITWTGIPQTGKMKILLYQGTSLKGTISASAPNSGLFDWIVPGMQAPGDYTVRVVWLSKPAVLGNSAPFTVVATAGPITVTPPPAPVSQGAVKTITWSGIPQTGNVKILLYQGTSLKGTISASAPNNGSFTWIVPGTQATGNYTVRVVWLSKPAVLGESAAFTVVATAGPIAVTRPAAPVAQGAVKTITWSGIPLTGNVKILLYQGTSLKGTISVSAPNNGSFTWAVPVLQAPGSYTVRVVWLSKPAVLGDSAAFTVVATAGPIVVAPLVAPAQGAVKTITWSGIPLTGNVKILLYQGTSLKGTISASAPNNGSFTWIVPATQIPGDYTVRVVWLSKPSVLGDSAQFTVKATTGPIAVAPLEAPVAQGAVKTITWSGIPQTGNVKILLYQGVSLKGTISASAPNNRSFTWIVPGTQIPGDYTVRVVWLSKPSVLGNSALFTVEATAGPIAVTLPAGGADLRQGSVQEIAWSGIPQTGKVKLLLYQSGVMKGTISASAPNNGSFTWIVPGMQALGQYTVRVVWLSKPAVPGESGQFTVLGP